MAALSVRNQLLRPRLRLGKTLLWAGVLAAVLFAFMWAGWRATTTMDFGFALRRIVLSQDQFRQAVHLRAWRHALAAAANDPEFKYAFYGTRSLAVRNPEIYLRSDRIFAQVITSAPGFAKNYEIKDVAAEFFFDPNPQGPSFTFADVAFEKYQVTSALSTYPAGYPTLPYFDRRLSALATTLKSTDNKVTELEKAVQLYLQNSGERAKHQFIVYCADESAYLVEAESLLAAQTGQPAQTISGNPILIFNEQYVWYPLLARDDTPHSEQLQKIVARYGQKDSVPRLTAQEQRLLAPLTAVTTLPSADSITMATLVALSPGSAMMSRLPDAVREQLVHAGIRSPPPWRVWQERANRLSPISAYLAASFRRQSERAAISGLSAEYLQLAAAKQPWAHGHAWTCGMYEAGVEHSHRTRAGHCTTQTANVAAALNLADVEHYRLAGFAKTGATTFSHHDFIYLPAEDLIISNGRVGTQSRIMGGTVVDQQRSGPQFTYITFLEHHGKWASWPGTHGPYLGTLAPHATLEILQRLRERHGEDLQTAAKVPSSTAAGRSTLQTSSFEPFTRYLLAEDSVFTPYKIP